MNNAAPETLAAARAVFAYLSATDPLPETPVDAVLGFGTFDLALAEYCGALFTAGRVGWIVFTGGFGAGTADLGRPEADAWRDALFAAHPAIPRDRVIVENRSTNTAENVAFTAALLASQHPPLAFGAGLRTALMVAAPSRLRRAKLTLQQRQPGVTAFRSLPAADFDREYTLHESKGIAFVPHLLGELDRITTYPARGWIAAEAIPPEIAAAHAVLQSWCRQTGR
ncbi:MAG TPA: YdcF family protein [Opitutus sp.]|nr:YdcF family protein [Opitutus sp.]